VGSAKLRMRQISLLLLPSIIKASTSNLSFRYSKIGGR
jgi:hypothetical protein